MEKEEAWTDGCSNKNGSGWAVICPNRKTIYRGELVDLNGQKTTNQKAELSAIIQAIHFLGPNLHIYSDSEYSIKCFSEWYQRWLRNGWKTAKNKPVENRPLIELGLQMGANKVEYTHVNGHVNIPFNEMADYYCKYDQLKPEDQQDGWTILN